MLTFQNKGTKVCKHIYECVPFIRPSKRHFKGYGLRLSTSCGTPSGKAWASHLTKMERNKGAWHQQTRIYANRVGTLFFSSLYLCSLIQGGDSYAGIKRSAGWHFACMSQLPSSKIPFPFHLSLSKSHVSVKAASFTFNTFFWPWQPLFTWLEHCLGLSDCLPKQFPLF